MLAIFRSCCSQRRHLRVTSVWQSLVLILATLAPAYAASYKSGPYARVAQVRTVPPRIAKPPIGPPPVWPAPLPAWPTSPSISKPAIQNPNVSSPNFTPSPPGPPPDQSTSTPGFPPIEPPPPPIELAVELQNLAPCVSRTGSAPRRASRPKAAIDEDTRESLMQVGIDILNGAHAAGRYAPLVGQLVAVVETAQWLTEAATEAVEERTDQIEAELIVIHRSDADLRRFIENAGKFAKDSPEYRERRRLYYKWVRTHLIDEMKALPPSSQWSFLLNATTSDPTIVMHELRFVGKEFAKKLLGEHIAKWLGIRESVRWNLGQQFAVGRTLTQAEWKVSDRIARRIAGALEEIAGDPDFHAKVIVASKDWFAEVSEYGYQDCFDIQVTWYSPKLTFDHPEPAVAHEIQHLVAPALSPRILESEPRLRILQSPPPADNSSSPATPMSVRDLDHSWKVTSTRHRACEELGACEQLIHVSNFGWEGRR